MKERLLNLVKWAKEVPSYTRVTLLACLPLSLLLLLGSDSVLWYANTPQSTLHLYQRRP